MEPIDEELQATDDVNETIKCGAIQLNLEKLTFSFECIYCNEFGQQWSSLRAFAEHLQEHLTMTDAESDILLKNSEEDSEHTQSVDESVGEDELLPDEDAPLQDYQIEMLEESGQGNMEVLSYNENTEDQYVYQVRVLKSELNETQFEETFQPDNADLEHSEIDEAPNQGFDTVPKENFEFDEDKMGNETNCICEICGIKFAEPSTLRVHLQRHNRCQFCYKHFATKTQLRQHIKTHVGRKTYICEECGQGYKNSESLKAHQRRHITEELYLCNTCGKSFYEERSLCDHIKTHTSARPFICKECNMTFSRQEALILHLTMHTDIRKFSCTICRMTFAQNSGLLSHMKEKHRNNFDIGE